MQVPLWVASGAVASSEADLGRSAAVEGPAMDFQVGSYCAPEPPQLVASPTFQLPFADGESRLGGTGLEKETLSAGEDLLLLLG